MAMQFMAFLKHKLTECKRLAKKGDMTGARLVANQVARYRRLHDRNLESSVLIGTKAQAMVSDHKVNKAEIETVKGYMWMCRHSCAWARCMFLLQTIPTSSFAYANMYESFNRMESREQRYAFRMGAINHLESGSMWQCYRAELLYPAHLLLLHFKTDRDAIDGMFRADEESANLVRTRPTDPADQDEANEMRSHEFEVHTILQQALNNGKRRVYQRPEDMDDAAMNANADAGMQGLAAGMTGMAVSSEAPFVLNLKLAEHPSIGAAVTLSQTPLDPVPFHPTLNTVDFVKRKVIQDTYAVSQLNLYTASGLLRPFQLVCCVVFVLNVCRSGYKRYNRHHQGRLASGEFRAFDFSETVTSAGLHSGATVYVKVLRSAAAASADEHPQDEEIREVRERINRLNAGTPKF